MADVEVLKNLVDQQIKDSVAAREEAKAERDEANRRHDESQQIIKDYQQTINDLLAVIQRQRAAAPVGPALPGVSSCPPRLKNIPIQFQSMH